MTLTPSVEVIIVVPLHVAHPVAGGAGGPIGRDGHALGEHGRVPLAVQEVRVGGGAAEAGAVAASARPEAARVTAGGGAGRGRTGRAAPGGRRRERADGDGGRGRTGDGAGAEDELGVGQRLGTLAELAPAAGAIEALAVEVGGAVTEDDLRVGRGALGTTELLLLLVGSGGGPRSGGGRGGDGGWRRLAGAGRARPDEDENADTDADDEEKLGEEELAAEGTVLGEVMAVVTVAPRAPPAGVAWKRPVVSDVVVPPGAPTSVTLRPATILSLSNGLIRSLNVGSYAGRFGSAEELRIWPLVAGSGGVTVAPLDARMLVPSKEETFTLCTLPPATGSGPTGWANCCPGAPLHRMELGSTPEDTSGGAFSPAGGSLGRTNTLSIELSRVLSTLPLLPPPPTPPSPRSPPRVCFFFLAKSYISPKMPANVLRRFFIVSSASSTTDGPAPAAGGAVLTALDRTADTDDIPDTVLDWDAARRGENKKH
uniref:Uncharacterized protein n=1 Tax=Anopheles atroparvus TaxID=41427 RepID=A0A182IZ97_ANOAO